MPHGIYPDDFAEVLKSRAGQKWRPSNGTEGEIFTDSWCANCRHDVNHNCKILGATFVFAVDDSGYPEEWQYGENGQPKCTAYEKEAA